MKIKYDINRYMPAIRILTIIMVSILLLKISLFLYPFTIAIMLSIFSQKIANKMSKIFKFEDRKVKILIITMLFFAIIGLIGCIVFLFMIELLKLSNWISNNYVTLHNYGNLIIDGYNKNIIKLPNYLQAYIKNGINSFVGKFSDYIYRYINSMFLYAKYLPEFILSIILTITSTYIISNNMEEVKNFFIVQFPKKWLNKMNDIRINSIEAVFTYLKSQLIIISLVFVFLIIGFYLVDIFAININYIIVLSFIGSFMDALPLIGTGPLLQPWILYLFVIGEYKGSFGILLLYIGVSLFRMTIEPYILTDNFDLHPIMSLLSMFVGFILFGIVGFLLGPILFITMKIIFEDEINLGFFKVLSGEKKNE